MKGIRGIAVGLALVTMAQPALAGSSLCVEEVVSGLIWKNEAWASANFNTTQYLIRGVASTEGIAEQCAEQMRQKGLSEQPEVVGASSSWWGCYGMAEVGTELDQANVTYCKVLAAADGVPFAINCDDALWSAYLQPNGEFQVTRAREARINWGPGAPGRR